MHYVLELRDAESGKLIEGYTSEEPFPPFVDGQKVTLRGLARRNGQRDVLIVTGIPNIEIVAHLAGGIDHVTTVRTRPVPPTTTGEDA